jgi:DNA-binding response OmpR family regulator
LILLDASLPDGNGIKSISSLKEAFPLKYIPIIVLSADGDVISKVAALGIGADDYIQKPPNTDELRARIQARLRDTQTHQKALNLIHIGDLVIDSNKMSVEQSSMQNGQVQIELTLSEFKLLKLMSLRPGQIFSRDQLIDEVWGIAKFITQRTIDAHVSHLRRKLLLSTVKIETVLSVGYKIEVKKLAQPT